MDIPNIPIPPQFRRDELNKAVWDYIRGNGLSFDEATAVKHEAEQAAANALDAIIARVQGARE